MEKPDSTNQKPKCAHRRTETLLDLADSIERYRKRHLQARAA
jgi:hypothetical protein